MRYVLKFGGTSLGSRISFENIKEILKSKTKKLIIVSAASKSTNYLINMFNSYNTHFGLDNTTFLEYKNHEINLNKILEINNLDFNLLFDELETLLTLPPPKLDLDLLKLRDNIISFGERISMYRLHYYLNLHKISSIAKQSWELGFITDSNYGEATLLKSSYEKIKNIVDNIQDEIIITTGFIGKNITNNITTLGRGGSDLSASLFSVAINSPEIQIWSDVPGIMSCDPRIISSPKLINEMTYDEALELSFHGAKILHPKTVEPLLGKNISMRVLNTFDINCKGTLIKKGIFNKNGPTGLSFSKDNKILQIMPKDQLMTNGFISKIFDILNDNHCNLVSISKTTMSIAVNDISENILKELSRQFNIEVNKHISVICLVGENMHNKLGVASKFFQTITDCNINIEMISQSSIQSNILVAVKDEHLIKLLTKLHEIFF